MQLVTFGDSFVEGLIKEPTLNSCEERERICFPRQIVNRSSVFHTIDNHAVRGSANDNIAYEVFKYAMHYAPEDKFILVVFSGIGRIGQFDPIINKYITAKNVEQVPERQLFFHYDMLTRGIHSMLESYGFKFAMINSLDPSTTESTLGNWINGKEANNSLADIIREIYLDPSQHATFNCNPSPNEYITQCLHPTERGHKLIAATLSPLIEEAIRQSH